MITIKEALTKKEMKQFVKFPFELYKGNKYWVPPIIKDELAGFDREINPVFMHATVQFLLAYKNNKIVGRVAAIINHTEVEEQKIRKMRFGWFDVIDDVEVTKVLLEKVYAIGKENNLEIIEGPLGFSNMDKVGALTKGYDSLGTMITWYNHPYYITHFEKLGYKEEKGFIETTIQIKDIHIEKYAKFSKILQKRYGYKVLNFNNSKEIMPYVEEMFQLFQDSFAKLSSFVPITDEQIQYFKKKYISFINPEYIKFVLDTDNNIIAFAIQMPYFAKAMQKAKGKLFPFGIFHLLKAKKKNDTVISYLIGVHPDFQRKGVTAIVFDEFYKSVTANGITRMIITPQLKTNKEIQKIWYDFKPVYHKERATYIKNIS
jgi:hypothetical protein